MGVAAISGIVDDKIVDVGHDGLCLLLLITTGIPALTVGTPYCKTDMVPSASETREIGMQLSCETYFDCEPYFE